MKRILYFTIAVAVLFALAAPVAWRMARDLGKGKDPRSDNPIISHGGPVRDYVSLVDDLRKRGAEVEPAGEIQQPFFSVTGSLILIDGAAVQVFEYMDEAAAMVDADAISADGGSPVTTVITWVDTPHFYHSGRLIALYVGQDAAVLDLLTASLGAQIAGG